MLIFSGKHNFLYSGRIIGFELGDEPGNEPVDLKYNIVFVPTSLIVRTGSTTFRTQGSCFQAIWFMQITVFLYQVTTTENVT